MAYGQSIINGDFENVTQEGCFTNPSNANFNMIMPDVTAFGSYNNVDIVANDCSGYGLAPSGTHFIGVGVQEGPMVDKIAMKLSGPLMGGVLYRIHFFIQKSPLDTTNAFYIGLSNDSISEGTVLAEFSNEYGNEWSEKTAEFSVPSDQGGFITFIPISDVWSWIQLDHFWIEAIGVGVMEKKELLTTVWPNPASEVLHVQSSEHLASVQVYDLTGKSLLRKNVNGNSIELDLGHFAKGNYLLETTTTELNTVITKFSKQ